MITCLETDKRFGPWNDLAHHVCVQYVEGDTRGRWDLKGQIKHKLDFIADHLLPTRRRFILIGHSIGCYMILKMLRELADSQVLRCCLLFPTIERMSQSPSGIKVTPLLRYLRWTFPFFTYPLYYLTTAWFQRRAVEWYFRNDPVLPCAINATLKLNSPDALGNVSCLSHDEMNSVTSPDLEIITKNIDKLFMYYGADDHWCPVEYYHDMKGRFPSGSIFLCEHDIEHAFVLRNSHKMAEFVHKWLVDHGALSE